jgi:acetyl-CoA carboxylase carboxyltransferase component
LVVSDLKIETVRIDGVVTGVFANQPIVKVGGLDVDASDNGARIFPTCDASEITLVKLGVVTGYLSGLVQECSNWFRRFARMRFFDASVTTLA